MDREDATTIARFESGLAEIAEVRHAERLFGDPDYLIRVATADLAAYQEMRDAKLGTLPGVQRLSSTIVMKRIVDDRPYPRDAVLGRAQLDGQECLCRGQACAADGRQQPGQGADDDGRGQAAGPGFGRDDDGLAVAAGVGGGGGRAGDDSGGGAGQGQQDRLGQELGADLASGGAQRAAQPDLRAAFQHRDDHDVGHPDRADQQRDRAQAEEQGVERALGVGPGGERVRGLGDVDLAGAFRGAASARAVPRQLRSPDARVPSGHRRERGKPVLTAARDAREEVRSALKDEQALDSDP